MKTLILVFAVLFLYSCSKSDDPAPAASGQSLLVTITGPDSSYFSLNIQKDRVIKKGESWVGINKTITYQAIPGDTLDANWHPLHPGNSFRVNIQIIGTSVNYTSTKSEFYRYIFK